MLDPNIPTGTPPPPGTFAHAVLVGKLAFFTALGVAENGLLAEPVRDIDPHQFRGRQSNNAWSSCASCHPDGLTDNVAWIFADGPRNTIALDAFFAKDNPADQRISNWSAVRSSVTDFNNNSRAVQGGVGFAFVNGDPMVPNPNILNHGISQGASDALDLQTLWVQTIRPLNQPQPANVSPGRGVFEAQLRDLPRRRQVDAEPGPVPERSDLHREPEPAACCSSRVRRATTVVWNTGPQIVRMRRDPGGAGGDRAPELLEPVGTFNAGGPMRYRSDGTAALGGLGFNVPSLLGSALGAPFLHDGSAADPRRRLHRPRPRRRHHREHHRRVRPERRSQAFLGTIDGRTAPLRSATDEFKDALTP